MRSMIVHCCVTPAHEVLLEEYFRPSLPIGWDLEVHWFEIEGRGDFLSSEFLKCIRWKIDRMIESLAPETGEILIWSDVDTVFLQRDSEELGNEISSLLEGKSLLFQREGRGIRDVNTGFVAMRADETSLAFWKQIRDLLDQYKDWNEQRAANYLLFESPEKFKPGAWEYFLHRYYCRTQGWPPPPNLTLYHANYTRGADGIGQKIKQFERIESYLKAGWLKRRWMDFEVLRERGLGNLVKLAWRRIPKVKPLIDTNSH